MHCSLCQELGGQGKGFEEQSFNVLLAHSEIHVAQLNRSGLRIGSVEAFSKCFPIVAEKSINENVPVEKTAQNEESRIDDDAGKSNKNTGPKKPKQELSITEYCRRSIIDNHEHGKPVRCSLCRRTFRIWSRNGGVLNGAALNHVYTHMTKTIFHCDYCDFGSTSPYLMYPHLQKEHNCGLPRFADSIDLHRDYLIGLIDDCFGKKFYECPTDWHFAMDHDYVV